MAKATGRKAAGKTGAKAKRKPAVKATAKTTRSKSPATKARKPVAARKVIARKPTAAKRVAKKRVVGKPTAAKVKARQSNVRAKSKKAATTAEARTTVTAKKPAVRSRQARGVVLEISPAVIDTSAAAEVAARLVIGAAHPSPAGAFGTVFDPPSVLAVKRASSALRHVKETLHKPVAEQLEDVFGPAAVRAESTRGYLKGDRVRRAQRPGGSSSVHLGQSNVPRRSVG